MEDITNRNDLDRLMATFYGSLLADKNISYIFTDVVKIDLPSHLPHIVDFWEQNLFNTGNYRNNVMQVHMEINAKEHLSPMHFKTWLSHLETAVDTMFKGINAERIKTRALSIATIMQLKLANS
jgi:hemoglobin